MTDPDTSPEAVERLKLRLQARHTIGTFSDGNQWVTLRNKDGDEAAATLRALAAENAALRAKVARLRGDLKDSIEHHQSARTATRDDDDAAYHSGAEMALEHLLDALTAPAPRQEKADD